jgi:hypothetical protein
MIENGAHEFLPTIVGAKFGKLTKEQVSRLQVVLDTLSDSSSPQH